MPESKQDRLQLEQFLPYVLNRLADRVSEDMSALYTRDYGLTVPEWRIVANLAEHQTLNARTIVSLTGMEKTKVSRAVSALDQRGLVAQRVAPADSRSRDLSLTASGKRLYRKLVPAVLKWERQLLAEFNQAEQQQLLDMLGRLNHRLQDPGSSGG